MKMSVLKKAAIAAAAVFVLFLACGWIHLAGVGCPSFALSRLPDPTETADSFFGCIKSGDFAGGAQYIYNCDSFGFDEEPELEAGRVLRQGLVDNFDYEVSGVSSKQGVYATVDVELSVLDLSLMAEDYEKKTTEIAEEAQWQGVEIYNEEYALSAAAQAASALLEAPDAYISTDRYQVDLVYADGRWQIICDEALWQTLTGTPVH